MTLEELHGLVGDEVRLSFRDGFVVIAKLISVEPVHVGTEIVYDPLQIIEPAGRSIPTAERPVLADDFSMLERFEKLSDLDSVT